ncbi:uncharacterized protein LACBIDRAFT_330430 [Laccaria bicolor S238N-H82]|uniref:Predicted protein n=1 Tax=Laccaria bicolor (strain S238N-H82 / ATCC MYA-4686) TaxID=486041 RepID=B0DLA1_LACBS|nr:uncharacterized protein LACBIDRAFT_330430 [Laccaria bicolor S238N-H82]EDR04527.1 predicted protein [Laccaria bicolor S238N-H82]|eukprot:XP_001884699.1 predicted protein [Laccaria bicolor S238N-H82]
MRFMLQCFPHHQGHLSSEALVALAQGHPWSVVHPTQPLLMEGEFPRSNDSGYQGASISAGKKKVDWDDTAPWDERSSSVEQGRDFIEGAELSFGFQTPFRTNAKFFDTSSSIPPTPFSSAPGTVPALDVSLMQDVTVGLAMPSCTIFGDNVRDHNTTPNQSLYAMALSRQTNLVSLSQNVNSSSPDKGQP